MHVVGVGITLITNGKNALGAVGSMVGVVMTVWVSVGVSVSVGV